MKASYATSFRRTKDHLYDSFRLLEKHGRGHPPSRRRTSSNNPPVDDFLGKLFPPARSIRAPAENHRFENAQSEATRLDKIFNQDASIIEEQLQSGKTIFKIALGSFITEEEANLFLQNLEKHAIKGLIRKIEY